MGITINPNEVELNGTKYPLIGKVQPSLISVPAGKIVIGDYGMDSDPLVSPWAVNDQRGGILVEEMDEKTQNHKAWWSTCNLGYKGHILLPRLATEVAPPTYDGDVTDGGLENWTGSLLDSWTYGGTTHIFAKDGTTKDSGSYSAKWTSDGYGTDYIYQDMSWNNKYRNVTAVFAIKFQTEQPGGGDPDDAEIQIAIHDGVAETASAWTKAGSFTALTVTRRLNAAATQLRMYIRFKYTDDGGGGSPPGYGWADTCTLTLPTTTVATADLWENFNSDLYHICGESLVKLNATGDGWTQVYDWIGETPTSLTATPDGYLMIGLGDTTVFDYMDTSEAMTSHAAESGATFAIQWDGKMFKMDASGNMEHETDITANPWTDSDSGGSIANYNATPKELDLYRDASGTYIIYCATTKGTFAYDLANTKWIETELGLPEHATCGMGLIHWRDAQYVSAGLDVHQYTAAETAMIRQVGLNNDDGLPEYRGGEIVKFIKGYNEFFALVDSVYEGATSRSTVMAYDGNGWQCWWKAGSDNLAMHSGIVSSEFAHRLWFSSGTTSYYIPLQKNIRNPKKVSAFTYDSAGVHMTPWFDADYITGTKLALWIKIFCKDTTANETVQVSYRIDHSSVNIGTVGSEWTSLGTIVAAGDGAETKYTFGTSAVGVEFKSIQFRFDLVRGGTNTKSPDVQYFVLGHLKNITPAWGYRLTLDCESKAEGYKTPKQRLADLKTAAETIPLVALNYRDSTSDTVYGRIRNVSGNIQTGQWEEGQYTIFVVVP